MAAQSRDVRAGWAFYRHSGFEMDLDEINRHLAARGFRPVAERSYQHYRKLHRYGYERYVPINQLDVETLRNPVWNGPLRSRYLSRRQDDGLTLLLVIENQVITLPGETVELSPVELVARFRGNQAALVFAANDVEGVHGLVTFDRTNQTRSVMFELTRPSDLGDVIDVTFSFLDLISPPEITGRLQSLPGAQARVTIQLDDSDSPIVVLQNLYAFFEALDAARLVCDEMLSVLDEEQRFVLPNSRLEQLHFGSPLLMTIYAASSTLMVLMAVVGRYEVLRRRHHEATEKKNEASIKGEQARALRIQNDQAQFRVDLERAVVTDYIESSLRVALAQPVTAELEPLPEDARARTDELVERQLLPSIDHLLACGINDMLFDATLDVPPLPEDAGTDSSNQQGTT